MTTPAEARLLADPAVQAAEASAIAAGIVRYLTTDAPGSGYNGTHVTGRVLTTGGTRGCVDPPLDMETPLDPVHADGFDDDDGGVHQPAIDVLAGDGVFDGTECALRSCFISLSSNRRV